MAQQQLRKRRLEEKLCLNQEQTIKSGFDQETMDIVWDIMNKKFELRDHPLIKYDKQSRWVFFLVVYHHHAAIWAVEEKHMRNLYVLEQEYLTPYDSGECLKASSVIRRFHVVLLQDDYFYVLADDLELDGKEPQFDTCLYVGTLTLSFRALKVIMAMIADQNYLLFQSDCLEYCKQFVKIYFDLIEEEISNKQTHKVKYDRPGECSPEKDCLR